MKGKKYRLNKEKFIEFLCGIGCAAIWTGCVMALLLKL